MCRLLSYNPDAIKPFLCRPLEKPGKHFFGEAVYAKEERDPEYLFHTTRLGNFINIIKSGLLSSCGSIGGAGQIMAGGKFKTNEIGYIFATGYPYAVDRYIYNYDKLADEMTSEGNSVENIPILLRFKPLPNEVWIPDPKDKKALKSRTNIDPSRLEFLSYEGWISLKTPAGRNQVSKTVRQILNTE